MPWQRFRPSPSLFSPEGLERARIAIQRFGADLAEPSGPFKANSDGENYPGLPE
jgi:hypothetical protein